MSRKSLEEQMEQELNRREPLSYLEVRRRIMKGYETCPDDHVDVMVSSQHVRRQRIYLFPYNARTYSPDDVTESKKVSANYLLFVEIGQPETIISEDWEMIVIFASG